MSGFPPVVGVDRPQRPNKRQKGLKLPAKNNIGLSSRPLNPPLVGEYSKPTPHILIRQEKIEKNYANVIPRGIVPKQKEKTASIQKLFASVNNCLCIVSC
jgi:hypothetical protein